MLPEIKEYLIGVILNIQQTNDIVTTKLSYFNILSYQEDTRQGHSR
jgi:hypothetical protein